MIPPLDQRGLLPHGVHTSTLAEVEARFATNGVRELRLAELRRFIATELRPIGDGLELFAGGSYFSDKVDPGDIDCTIEIPAAYINDRLPLIALFNDGRSRTDKGRIWHEYRVEIYPTLVFPGHNDFKDFFQYVGEKTAALKNLNAKDRRGIIKVESWTLG